MASGFAPPAGRTQGGLAGLGRAGIRGTLHRDRETPLSSVRLSPLSRDPLSRGPGHLKAQSRAGDGGRAGQQERHTAFLRQQHKETLRQLHLETERLKRENRELSFRLVMCHCDQQREQSGSASTDALRQLQDEVQRLRQELAEEKFRNEYMSQSQPPTKSMTGIDYQPTHQLLKGEKAHQEEQPAQTDTERKEENYPVQDKIKLPALKPHLPGGVADRQRRRQAMQRRFSRTRLLPLVHPPS